MSQSRDSRSATTLPGKYYTCEALFSREMERIFARSWLCAGRDAELSVCGDFRLLEIGPESVILLRDGEGQLRAFFNVCRHRGTRLCETDGGGPVKTIRCAYHGWTYDLRGELVAAPNMKDVAGFTPDDYPLHAVATAEWEGFAFVNLSPEPPAFDDAFAPLLTRFLPWSLRDLVSVARREYTVRANWKLLFQNYNECYHCPRIHPRLNELSPFRSAANDLDSGPFLGGPMQLADGVASMTATGALCGKALPQLNAADRRRVYYYSLFPTLLLSPHPDFVLGHRIEPIDVKTTRVICEFLFPPDVAARPEFDPSPAVDFWHETNRQDWHVCELSQLGVSSRAYTPGPYSNLESTVAAFDQHYRDVLGAE